MSRNLPSVVLVASRWLGTWAKLKRQRTRVLLRSRSMSPACARLSSHPSVPSKRKKKCDSLPSPVSSLRSPLIEMRRSQFLQLYPSELKTPKLLRGRGAEFIPTALKFSELHPNMERNSVSLLGFVGAITVKSHPKL